MDADLGGNSLAPATHATPSPADIAFPDERHGVMASVAMSASVDGIPLIFHHVEEPLCAKSASRNDRIECAPLDCVRNECLEVERLVVC